MDKTLAKLIKEYDELENRLSEIDYEISELEDEKDEVRKRLDILDERKELIEKQIFEDNISKLNAFTDDKFTNEVIVASYFAEKEEARNPVLNTIQFTDNELIALDGYKAIIIKSDSIPDVIKNKKIMWNIRADYKNSICDVEDSFDVKSLFQTNKECIRYIVSDLNEDNFYNIFKVNYEKDGEIDLVMLNYENFKITFNKNYLDVMFKALQGKTFKVGFSEPVSPMVVFAENMEMLILPVRLFKR